MHRRLAVLLTTVLALGLVGGPVRAESSSHRHHHAAPSALRVNHHRAAHLPIGLSYGYRLYRMSDAELAAALDDAVRLHASWLRVDIPWDVLQPTQDTDNWPITDRVFAAAAQRHLQVLGVVSYSPAWARDPGCVTWTCPPADPATYSQFAQQAAARYAPLGLNAVELWNEPNLPMFWANPDPDRYGTMLQAASAAVRASAPTVKILVGGLAETGPGGGAFMPDAFLAQACSAGRCGQVDAVAFHPYTTPYLATTRTRWHTAWERMNRNSYGQASIRHVMQQLGLGGRKIWVTEFGAPTGGLGARARAVPRRYTEQINHVSERLQARIIASGIRQARRQHRLIGGFFAYTWMDGGMAIDDRENYFGLRRADGSAKPAWRAFRRAAP